MRRFFFALILSVFTVTITQAQTAQSNEIEDLVQAISESVGSDFDFTDLFQKLQNYQDNPLNINTASLEDLQGFMVLNDYQIKSLLRHRTVYGPLVSIFELQAVDGWDLKTVQLVAPFVTIDGPTGQAFPWAKLFKDGKHDLILRSRVTFPFGEGYDPALIGTGRSRYLGDPFGHYIRYRWTYGKKFSAGFVAEKDPGEVMFGDTVNKYGFDFYSGHLMFGGDGIVKNVLVGDYNLQFGQGLTLWSGLAFGKTPFIFNIKRQARGVVPYNSANEALFFRGVIAVLKYKSWTMIPFFSYRSLDGNLSDFTDTTQNIEETVLTSFNESGFHRTSSELADKNVIKRMTEGLRVEYAKGDLQIGFTGHASQLNTSVNRGDELYNKYEFQGKNLVNAGIDYNYSYRNFIFWGEGAISNPGGKAFTQGIMASLDPKLSMVLVFRNFDKDYHNFFANALSENTRNINEKGVYWGIQYNPAKKVTFSAYLDRFRFDWLKFQVNGPSMGTDFLGTIDYLPNRKTTMYLRAKYRVKQENSGLSDLKIDLPVDYTRGYVRYNIRYQAGTRFNFQSRVEVSFFEKNGIKERGYLLFHDINYKKVGSKVTLNTRFALFNTPSFNTAIYAYENDLLFFFAIPGYSGNGSRVYALVKYDIFKGTEISFKAAMTRYFDRDVISSGLDEIAGNRRYEARVQLRMLF